MTFRLQILRRTYLDLGLGIRYHFKELIDHIRCRILAVIQCQSEWHCCQNILFKDYACNTLECDIIFLLMVSFSSLPPSALRIPAEGVRAQRPPRATAPSTGTAKGEAAKGRRTAADGGRHLGLVQKDNSNKFEDLPLIF